MEKLDTATENEQIFSDQYSTKKFKIFDTIQKLIRHLTIKENTIQNVLAKTDFAQSTTLKYLLFITVLR